MSEPIVIKRYPNRKLYDTSKSCYVTLDEVAEDIRMDVNLVVIDNKTKKDITAKTLFKYAYDHILKKIDDDESYLDEVAARSFVKKLSSMTLGDILNK